MGKKKRDEMVSESGGSEAVVESIKRPRKETTKPEQTNASKPKKLNNASDKVKSVPTKEVTRESTKPATAPAQPNKNSKTQNVSSDSSSTSDSESEKQSNKNEKKSVSDSDSESDSDSSGSESSPTSRGEPDKVAKVKTVKSKKTANQQANSIANLIPAKTYAPSPMTTSSDSYHSDTEEEDKKRRKKQKKMLQMQMTKKMRRNPSRPKTTEVKQEIHSDMEEEGVDNLASNNDEVPEWPENDYSELLRRMEDQIPPKDNQKFDSRAAKLDWTKIAFNNYTAEECMEVWLAISRRIRRFRTLAEILVDAREWISKPWTNFYRGVKKNRHPDMPTRPLSTYMLYYMEHKDKIAKENPGLDMTQVSKIISEMYKNLSTEERDKYIEIADQQRQDFNIKLTEFYKEHPDIAQQHQQQKKTVKDLMPKGPRKASNPFKLFFQDQLKLLGNDPSKDKKTIEEVAKEKWRSLSDKKKLHYIDLALQDHNRYEDEMKAYKIEHPSYVPPNTYKSILNKDERNIKERLAGKPVKPPNSAYSLFSRVMLQSDLDVKSLPPKQRMALISKKWKEISNSQKSHYEAKVRSMQEAYKLEFASYLENLSPEDREEELRKCQPKRKRPERGSKKGLKKNAANKTTKKELAQLNLFKGEPEPPPVRVFDVFLQSFQPEKSRGLKEEDRLKEALKSWNLLSEAKKESFRKKHEELKQKYIKDFEIFLKSLSPEELKEFSVMKELAKKNKEAKVQRELINGNTGESNEESDDDDNGSSSDSDSDDSDSGKSSKSSSSSEDSE